MRRRSDGASRHFAKNELKDFAKNELKGWSNYLDGSLSNTSAVESTGLVSIDPSQINFATGHNVRAYFVGEDAGYSNSLGFQTNDNSDSMQLLFPDASSPLNGKRRREDTPVVAGDFVEMGEVSSGTHLDFFLIANGANNGTDTWWTDQGGNSDKFSHVVVYAQPDSPYILLGFEDLKNGGDKDYNEVLIAFDIGKENVQALIGGPEPTSWAILGTTAVTAAALRRRRKRLLETENDSPATDPPSDESQVEVTDGDDSELNDEET
jgi:hypothetical protein